MPLLITVETAVRLYEVSVEELISRFMRPYLVVLQVCKMLALFNANTLLFNTKLSG